MKSKHIIIIIELIAILSIGSILIYKNVIEHKESLNYLKENRTFKTGNWTQSNNPFINLKTNSEVFVFDFSNVKKTYKYKIEDVIEKNDVLLLTLFDSINSKNYQIKTYNKSTLELLEVSNGTILKFKKIKD